MASPTPASSTYLPHLNGLRALAILGVLIYHLRASYCPAGYFGVDLFLVISGFLLLRSLLKPGAEQNFHYGSYLLKKAWRIIPSWFVVTIVVCAVALCLLHPTRLGDILKTARYSAVFQADYYIDRSGDYFNIFSQQNPLLHYWYLSITQQLYIIAPLLIIPLARWCSRRAAIILLSSLAPLSLAYYILTTTTGLVPDGFKETLLHSLGTKTAYYHLVPRLWEILAGGAVLLLPEFAGKPRLRGLLGLLGLLGIAVSFYLYDTASPAVYLTIICSLLALRYASSGPAAWLLNLKPVQALGTISFSLYLWHWPIMVFWKYCTLEAPGAWGEIGMVALSLLLGTLSWYVIERLRTPRATGWKGTLQRCSLLLTIPVVLIGANKANKYAREEAAKYLVRRVTLSHTMPPETDADILRGLENLPALGLKSPVLRSGDPEGAPVFLLIGDSHAAHLSDALHAACQREGIRGLYLNNGVAPFWNTIAAPRPSDGTCWNAQIGATLISYLEQHPEIRCVLVALYWESRLKGLPIRDGNTGKPVNNENTRLRVNSAGLGEFCDKLSAIGRKAILLGDNPTFDKPDPLDEWERCQQLGRPYEGRHITPAMHESFQRDSHRLFHQLESEGRALYADLAAGLMEQGVYPDRVNGQFLYQDTNHLSATGSERVINHLMPRLLEWLGKQPRNEPATGQ